MATVYHVNPRIRAYGKARIDITRRARDEAEWQALWREPLHSFPFEFADETNFGIAYKVDDFAAEAGFFIDILGFPIRAFSPSYAQFTGPLGEFCFSISALREGETSTPPDTLRLQFWVENIMETAEILAERGVVFEQGPTPVHEGASQAAGYFRTPHGIAIDIWGEIAPKTDIHEYLENEDEIDDPETERQLHRLLSLPDEDEDDVDDDFPEDIDPAPVETELEPEYIDQEDDSDDDEGESQPPAQVEVQAVPQPARQQSIPAITGNRPPFNRPSYRTPSQSPHDRTHSRTQPHTGPSVWSARHRRGDVEVTYHEIEGESDSDDT